MAEGSVVRTLRDVTIAHTDGVSTYTVAKEAGDLTLDVPLTTVNLFLDRGRFSATPDIRSGDDQPMTFSYTAYERDVGSTTDATLMDLAVIYAGHYVTSNWTSTIGTSSDETTWTTNITVEGSDFGESDKTWTLTFCTLRASRSDGQPNTLSISGTSYVLRPTLS